MYGPVPGMHANALLVRGRSSIHNSARSMVYTIIALRGYKHTVGKSARPHSYYVSITMCRWTLPDTGLNLIKYKPNALTQQTLINSTPAFGMHAIQGRHSAMYLVCKIHYVCPGWMPRYTVEMNTQVRRAQTQTRDFQFSQLNTQRLCTRCSHEYTVIVTGCSTCLLSCSYCQSSYFEVNSIDYTILHLINIRRLLQVFIEYFGHFSCMQTLSVTHRILVI